MRGHVVLADHPRATSSCATSANSRPSITVSLDAQQGAKHPGRGSTKPASLPNMEDLENEPMHESPATWENVAVGKGKQVAGRVLRDEELIEEGEDQAEVAHEVREEFTEEHRA